MSRGGDKCLTLSKFLSMHLMILTDCLCAFSFGFTFWSLLTAALINSYNNLFNKCARWRFVMSNVNSEKMIPSSSAVPLNSKERLALSAHCFGLMSLNFSVVVQSLYSDQPRFQQKKPTKVVFIPVYFITCCHDPPLFPVLHQWIQDQQGRGRLASAHSTWSLQ